LKRGIERFNAVGQARSFPLEGAPWQRKTSPEA